VCVCVGGGGGRTPRTCVESLALPSPHPLVLVDAGHTLPLFWRPLMVDRKEQRVGLQPLNSEDATRGAGEKKALLSMTGR
jgi:hypothetical protein